ncbi:hypothetical protein BVRB_6g152980 [Beta vulgaris subsp. vulgaris]|nr:hypothetical protein BVRB_6g152980 [Beta vulgaris subsp. vulgaris]
MKPSPVLLLDEPKPQPQRNPSEPDLLFLVRRRRTTLLPHRSRVEPPQRCHRCCSVLVFPLFALLLRRCCCCVDDVVAPLPVMGRASSLVVRP